MNAQKRFKFLIAGSALLLLAIILLSKSCSSSVSQQNRIGVTKRENLEQRISVSGTLRGKRSAYITPSYIGFVTDLKVKVGDKVVEGQPLVKIAQTMDQPLNQIYPLRAPFEGVVTQVLRREGEFINETSGSTSVTYGSLIRIDDLSEVWLDAAVPETDVAKLEKGLLSIIKPNALSGITYQGAVQEISLSSRESWDKWDRGKVEFPISIQIINPDDKLKPGMSAVVDIIAAKAENVVVLPHEFVHRDGNTYYVIDSSDRVIPVEVGLSNESMVEIKKGLEEGTEVKMIDFTDVASGGSGGRRKHSSH